MPHATVDEKGAVKLSLPRSHSVEVGEVKKPAKKVDKKIRRKLRAI